MHLCYSPGFFCLFKIFFLSINISNGDHREKRQRYKEKLKLPLVFYLCKITKTHQNAKISMTSSFFSFLCNSLFVSAQISYIPLKQISSGPRMSMLMIEKLKKFHDMPANSQKTHTRTQAGLTVAPWKPPELSAWPVRSSLTSLVFHEGVEELSFPQLHPKLNTQLQPSCTGFPAKMGQGDTLPSFRGTSISFVVHVFCIWCLLLLLVSHCLKRPPHVPLPKHYLHSRGSCVAIEDIGVRYGLFRCEVELLAANSYTKQGYVRSG